MAYPEWLQGLLGSRLSPERSAESEKLAYRLRNLELRTICQTARCPNQAHCWSQGRATFLIMGEICTRGCRFCNLRPGKPREVEEDEPWRLLRAAQELQLRQLVVTSVTRDDLADGGAAHFAKVVRVVRRGVPGIVLELLTPDFQGQTESLKAVAAAGPDVWGHNIETVPRLYPSIRLGADYRRSLRLLAQIRTIQPGTITKSGLMLGLGETGEEISEVLHDLRQAGVQHLTLGQYLAPSRRHVPAARYVVPAEFDFWGNFARSLGFAKVKSGPLVRSSSP
ncbi:MAG TPA: lipoyl synthase [Desulfobacterales bacterium]|nr:lipoyl synthase [Desulfobacterales bacterium]